MKFLIFVVLICFNSFGQAIGHIEKVKLDSIEVIKARELCEKMVQSETFRQRRTLTMEFANALPRGVTAKDISTDEEFVKYITANLSLSKFKSLDEALSRRKILLDFETKLKSENTQLYSLLERANLDQLKFINAPIFERPF
ncbi:MULTISPECIES: hypothetical protein [unclassified Flavobacterium]|uniref:hypothetical protein n=1 Tax=unclassified Flavobacterium TaxID=196869 RepID=UPI001F136D01|nr:MULTISPECIES: hypothetical protein [unclassified Flavobacterium]UMY64664.1 hypothetical protein MKO97_09080 [Flavobacterium sp. HJ-32-4]